MCTQPPPTIYICFCEALPARNRRDAKWAYLSTFPTLGCAIPFTPSTIAPCTSATDCRVTALFWVARDAPGGIGLSQPPNQEGHGAADDPCTVRRHFLPFIKVVKIHPMKGVCAAEGTTFFQLSFTTLEPDSFQGLLYHKSMRMLCKRYRVSKTPWIIPHCRDTICLRGHLPGVLGGVY